MYHIRIISYIFEISFIYETPLSELCHVGVLGVSRSDTNHSYYSHLSSTLRPMALFLILKVSHSRGLRPLFLTVSFVSMDELIQEAGDDAEGTVITQFVPPYYLTELKTVALYRREFAKYFPSSKPSFVSLEGFVDAMVLVDGLKKARRELTREGLIEGIESMHDVDLGLGLQLRLHYSPKDHKGFDHVIPTVIRGGRAVPFTDLSTAAPK